MVSKQTEIRLVATVILIFSVGFTLFGLAHNDDTTPYSGMQTLHIGEYIKLPFVEKNVVYYYFFSGVDNGKAVITYRSTHSSFEYRVGVGESAPLQRELHGHVTVKQINKDGTVTLFLDVRYQSMSQAFLVIATVLAMVLGIFMLLVILCV